MVGATSYPFHHTQECIVDEKKTHSLLYVGYCAPFFPLLFPLICHYYFPIIYFLKEKSYFDGGTTLESLLVQAINKSPNYLHVKDLSETCEESQWGPLFFSS